jgi:hypothetical protein
MSCAFHAHTADTPCPHCAEAQGRPLAPYVVPDHHCKACQSGDMRVAEIEGQAPYRWCGQCGERAA